MCIYYNNIINELIVSREHHTRPIEEASNEAVEAIFEHVQGGNIFRKPGDSRIYAQQSAWDALHTARVQMVPFGNGLRLVNQGSLKYRLNLNDLELLMGVLRKHPSHETAYAR